jgi:zinc protease
VTLKDLEGAIDAVIAEVAEKGVTNEELERAKIKLVADVVYAQDSQATMARWYGAAMTSGMSIDAIKTWPDRVQAVTAEQVRVAARTWLDKRRSATGYLVKELPRPEESRS